MNGSFAFCFLGRAKDAELELRDLLRGGADRETDADVEEVVIALWMLMVEFHGC